MEIFQYLCIVKVLTCPTISRMVEINYLHGGQISPLSEISEFLDLFKITQIFQFFLVRYDRSVNIFIDTKCLGPTKHLATTQSLSSTKFINY